MKNKKNIFKLLITAILFGSISCSLENNSSFSSSEISSNGTSDSIQSNNFSSKEIIGGDYIYELVNNEATLIKYNGFDQIAEIPESIKDGDNSYKVTSIGKEAFLNNWSLNKVIIPDSVTSIGKKAFYYTNLLNIYISSNIKNIQDEAFGKCDSLVIYCESFSIPLTWDSSWNSSDKPVYLGVSKNEIIELNDTQYIINNNEVTLAKYNGSDRIVEIPESVKDGNNSYKVTSIGKEAFMNNSILNKVVIPDSVTSIGDKAFYYTALLGIYISNNIKNIGKEVFKECGLLAIYCELSFIPDTWHSLWNSSNRPVYLGVLKNEIVEINDVQYVIKNNEATLTRYLGMDKSFVVPTNVEKDGKTYDVTKIGDFAFTNRTDLIELTLTNKIRSIGESAFYLCNNLKSILIPNTVLNIGYNAFDRCDRLVIYIESVTVHDEWDNNWNSDRPVYKGINQENIFEINQCEYIIKNNEAVLSKYKGNDSNLVIPTSVEKDNKAYDVIKIGNNAFAYNLKLENIVIPTSITTIEDNAFTTCKNLTTIEVANSVESIGEFAFYRCNNLSKINISNNVTKIGRYAFYMCNNLIINCECLSEPNGWDDDWNYSFCQVNWGVSL